MLWSIALVACKPPDTPTPPGHSDDLVVSGVPSAEVPTVLVVTVDGPVGTARIEYGLDGEALSETTPVSPSSANHVLPVLGLGAGESWRWRAVVTEPSGREVASEEQVFVTPPAPDALGDLTIVVNDPDAQTRFVLANVIQEEAVAYAAILDRDGRWVWWAAAAPGSVIVTPELGIDGVSVVWAEYDFLKWADVGNLVRVALDGSSRSTTRLKLGHHDVVQHDDGTVAFLGMSFRDIDLPLGMHRMGSDQLLIGPEGMTDADEPTLLFDMFDDFPLDPEITCDHISDLDDKYGETDIFEWTHGNSLLFVEEDDAYYLGQKFTDWLIKIDRSTGEVDWTLNGRGTEFKQADGRSVWNSVTETSLWSHSHLSEVFSGGAMVFDNGDHHAPPLSRALEVHWDEDTLIAETVWEYAHPAGLATPALGDVRKLPGDNVLITWSGLGNLTEVTREKVVVWEAALGPDRLAGRIVPFDDLYAPLAR